MKWSDMKGKCKENEMKWNENEMKWNEKKMKWKWNKHGVKTHIKWNEMWRNDIEKNKKDHDKVQ